jgi:polygalacturonase
MQYDVKQFGATGDGRTNDTASLQAAINRCADGGGGTVSVPAGGYVTGSLWLRSNLTLDLHAGATLLGSQDVDDFPVWTSAWEGPGVKPGRAALLCGEGLENVAVTGRGTVDGRGKVWWDHYHAAPGKLRRPFLCRIVDSRNVLIEGVTFRNSPMWTVSPLACDNVTISRITVVNPPDSPNTDGINPDSCRNVRISDCHVDVGDDCITIKSGKEDEGRRQLRPCENITVTNCTLEHGHGGVVIGSEMSGNVRNVTITNCVFVGTDRGIRIKARRGRGGVVEDVRASDLVMDRVLCPIVLNLFYGCGAWDDPKVTDQGPQSVNAGTPRFRRLRFSNITARGIQYAAAYMMGLPEMFNEDVIFENCSFFMDPNCTVGGSPAMAPGVPDHCRAGVIARNIKRLTLRNLDISDQLGPAITVSGAKDLQLTDITLRTPVDGPLVVLQDIHGGRVRGCHTPPSQGRVVDIARTNVTKVRMEIDRYEPRPEPGSEPVGQA